MVAQVTLYGILASPYVDKVELALKEGNIPYKYFTVDLFNKPAWFTEQINPVGRVPSITYGGPEVPPDEPSSESIKVSESNVILEFLADAFPEAKLMPTDLAQRARVRLFMDAVVRKCMPAFLPWIFDSEPRAAENLLKAIELMQGLLSEGGEYAVGDNYTIADACITPFIHRLHLVMENDIGRFPVGGGAKLGELLKDSKYAKFTAYASAILARQGTKEVFVPKHETVKDLWTKRFGRGSTFQPSLELLQGRT